MAVKDNYPNTECSNCGGDCTYDSLEAHRLLVADLPIDELTINEFDYVAVNNGWCLDLTGHYGGFTDDLDHKLLRVTLCHDCCLAVARALPGVFDPRKGGSHSMFYDEAHTSCCEFAWGTDENGDITRGDGEGGWKKVDDVSDKEDSSLV